MTNNISSDLTVHPSKDQPSSREQGRRKATHGDSRTDVKIIHRITERQHPTFQEKRMVKQSIRDGYPHCFRYELTDIAESIGARYADRGRPECWDALLDFLKINATPRVVRGQT